MLFCKLVLKVSTAVMPLVEVEAVLDCPLTKPIVVTKLKTRTIARIKAFNFLCKKSPVFFLFYSFYPSIRERRCCLEAISL
jgi:hypothetical protein